MDIDDQDRILVTEYRANKVALFDTRTEQSTEYHCRRSRSLTGPQIDKNGEHLDRRHERGPRGAA